MNEQTIRQKLTESGLRVTYPRLALIAELQRNETPRSAAELSATLTQFPRSSIYRNLEALEETNLIKSSMLKWVRRYELGDELVPHHHHLTCTQCGAVTQFDSPKLERQLVNAAQAKNYQLLSHVVELRGLCRICSGQPIASASMLSQSINTMKRLRPADPIMEKLKHEDHYLPFTGEDEPSEKP